MSGLKNAVVGVILVIGVLCGPAHAGYPYVGLWADSMRTTCDFWAPEPYSEVEMWIWWLPDPAKGMGAGEFKIEYPSSTLVIRGNVTPNPLIQVELGTLANGISWTVGGTQCQTDWFWSHHQTLIVKSTTQSGWVLIVPDPHLTAPPYDVIVASCELGFPPYACTKLTDGLAINTCCFGTCYGGLLEQVIPRSFTQVRAFFDVQVFQDCPPPELKGNFRLYPESAPDDSVIITHAELAWVIDSRVTQVDISLAAPLTDGTTYVLQARDIHDCECRCVLHPNSQCEFTFVAATATLLQSSSASVRGDGIELSWELSSVDDGVSFFVSRAENDGDFLVLDASGLTRDVLTFTYLDRSVEPGRSYTYKVEYGVGAPSRTLFISEAVSTPPMPLTLYQNKPNPFNPSTTISFYLPQESIISLEVYDISGRLVARLVAGERRGAGTHQVEWNGRDSRGAGVASGVYFYRLNTGKQTISKKMVLLK